METASTSPAAIFDGTQVKTVRQEPIEADDVDLRAAAELWDLRTY